MAEMSSSNGGRDAWADLLLDPDVKESGGANNNEGVDFARYWAMSQLLALEEAGAADYAIVFEYLQDVMVLDSAETPQTVALFQVKKKENGQWSRKQLCAASGPGEKASLKGGALKGSSILGKLYVAVEKASDCIKVKSEGIFVFNGPCKFADPAGGGLPPNRRKSLSTLDPLDRNYIEKAIALELGKERPLPHFSVLHLERTGLSPSTMRDTVRGFVDEFLDKHHPLMPNVSGRIVESLLGCFSEASRPSPGLDCLGDIIRAKGYTRRQFTELLTGLSKVRPFPAALDTVVDGLKSEGMPSRTADFLEREALRIKIEIMRHPDSEQTFLWNFAVSIARSNKAAETYRSIMDATVTALKEEARRRGNLPHSDVTWRAVALLAINHVDQEFATTNPQS